MTHLKAGASFIFDYVFAGAEYTIEATVIEECKPCAMAALGRPYITGPGPYLHLRPMIRGEHVPISHPLHDPFDGYRGLLAAAQTAYHHQGE